MITMRASRRARFASPHSPRGCCDRRRQRGFGNGNRGFAELELFKTRDHRGVLLLVFPFAAGGFDGAQNAAQDVHERKQATDDAGIRGQLAVAEQAEQVLASVGQRFEAAEAEEAGGPLDGVYRPENLRQKLGIAGARLQISEAPLHAVEPLLAFKQEFASEVVHDELIGRRKWNLRTAVGAGPVRGRPFCDSLRDA